MNSRPKHVPRPPDRAHQGARPAVDRRPASREGGRKRIPVSHVEPSDLDTNEKPLGTVKPVPGSQSPAPRRTKRVDIRTPPEHRAILQTHLHPTPDQHFQQDRQGTPTIDHVRDSPPGIGRPPSREPGISPLTGGFDSNMPERTGRGPDGPHTGMENSKSLGRDCTSHPPEYPGNPGQRGDHILRERNQGEPNHSFPARLVRGDHGGMDLRPGGLPPPAPTRDSEGTPPDPDPDGHDNSSPDTIRIQRPQHQTGGSRPPPVGTTGGGSKDPHDPPTHKARPILPRVKGHYSTLCDGPASPGTAPGNCDINLAAVIDGDWAATITDNPFRGPAHTLVTRRTTARLPRTSAEKSAPLHAPTVAPLNFASIQAELLSESSAARIRELHDLLSGCPKKLGGSSHRAAIDATDAQSLERAGIIERVAPGDCILGSAFTVVEEKHGKLRRRFILWPQAVNHWLESQGYKSQVNLNLDPFPAVHEECAGITDLTASFYQISLPSEWRHLFGFKTTEGHVYAMKVLPMGLNVSPEIMQILTSAIAGHPAIARKPAAGVQVNVWIDNIQVAGNRRDVERTMHEITSRATSYGVTLNSDETTISTAYNFTGIVFNHDSHTVQMAAKTHQKLALTDIDALTLEDLERLLGRLWFATRILDLPIQRYWWCLKIIRRLFSKWSRGLAKASDLVNLPPCAACELRLWYTAAVTNAPRVIPLLPASDVTCDLFTDATLEGWGAVCILHPLQRTMVAGRKWQEPAENINAAETRAVAHAFEAFTHMIPPGAKVRLHIDNTSALSAVQRGFSHSHAVNHELQRPLKNLPYSIFPRYIRSADNPADAPSRNWRYQTKRGLHEMG